MSKKGKVVHFLYPPEEKRFLSVIDDKRDLAIVKLFLECAIFTAELLNIEIDDFDYNKGTLRLSGFKECSKERTININDDVKEAINNYLKVRPISREIKKLFLNNGKNADPLTKHGLYRMFEKYQKSSNLAKKINANILRSTCIIRLFELDISFQKIVNYLGLHSGIELRFYEREAIRKTNTDQPQGIEEFDTRSRWQKLKDKLFADDEAASPPATLKLRRAGQPLSPLDGARVESGLFGREWLLQEIELDLKRGQSVLLVGDFGSGKTAMLKALIKDYTDNLNSVRQILAHYYGLQIGEKVSSRMTSAEIMTQIDRERLPVLPFDNVDKVRNSEITYILNSLPSTTWLLTAETLDKKLHFLKNKVTVYELNKLNDEQITLIINSRLPEVAMPQNLKEMLINKVKMVADGNPGVAHNLIDQLARRKLVKQRHISDLYDDSVVKPVDWSAFLLVIYSAIMVWRFVARGTYDTETYILSGIVYAIFMGMGFKRKAYQR